MKIDKVEYAKLTKILEIKDYNIKDNSKYKFNKSTLKFIKELSEKYDICIKKYQNLSYENQFIIFSNLYEYLINKNWKLAIDIDNFLKIKDLYNKNHDDNSVGLAYKVVINDMIIIHNIYNNWLININFD